MTVQDMITYDQLLDENDWDIYYWVTKERPAPIKVQSNILTLLQEHTKNKCKSILRYHPYMYPVSLF